MEMSILRHGRTRAKCDFYPSEWPMEDCIYSLQLGTLLQNPGQLLNFLIGLATPAEQRQGELHSESIVKHAQLNGGEEQALDKKLHSLESVQQCNHITQQIVHDCKY